MRKIFLIKYILLSFLLIACKKNENIKDENKIVSTEIEEKSLEQKNTNGENIPIEGKWEWKYNPNNGDVPEMLFTLSIQKSSDNQFVAQYCAIAQNGNRIDCSNDKDYNVKGIIKGNKIEATFYSFFDNKKTKANVELLILNKDSIEWKINNKVNFEFYAPTKCILTKKNKNKSEINKFKKNSLPFDFDNYNNDTENKTYSAYSSNDLPEITKIIDDQLNEYPSKIFIIDNGGLPFETYIFETDGDSVTQIIVNIKDNKVLSSEIVGYESDSENTFMIKKDLSIVMFKIDSKKNLKIVTENLQINQDGTIAKVK